MIKEMTPTPPETLTKMIKNSIVRFDHFSSTTGTYVGAGVGRGLVEVLLLVVVVVVLVVGASVVDVLVEVDVVVVVVVVVVLVLDVGGSVDVVVVVVEESTVSSLDVARTMQAACSNRRTRATQKSFRPIFCILIRAAP